MSSGPDPTPLDVSSPVQEAYWVDGGPLHGWAVVHSRLAHPVGVDQQARFMFTRADPATTAPVIQRWMDHLGTLGISTDSWPARLFWRLTVRQRSLALNAQPFGEILEALENARQVTRRADTFSVSFGFFPGEPIPKWVVRDDEGPVFVGLPQHHLVRVNDPRVSLAALLGAAQVRTKVHEVS